MKKILLLLISIIIALLLLVGCAGEPNYVHSPEDAAGTVIGALAGTPSFQLARDLGRTAVAYTDAVDMMNDLRSGVLDCVIMERTTAEELVSDTSGVRILAESLAEYELRIGVARENNALLNEINNALDALRANGTLRNITDRYFARRDFTFESIQDEYGEFAGYLNVAFPSDSPPFSFRNAEGRLVGMDVDIAVAVADFLGVQVRVIETDVANLVDSVWLGIADITLGFQSVGGEGIINVSQPYAIAEHVIIVRR